MAAQNDRGGGGGAAQTASEAAPCPLQPCYFDKWDFFADIWDCQYAMGFPVCIFMYQSKTIREPKYVSYDDQLCPVIAKGQRDPMHN